MKNVIVIFILFFSVSWDVFSQTEQIATDFPDVRIFPSHFEQSEVHISINKTDPLNLIVSANTYTNTYSQGYYFTLDGGITWFGSDDLPQNGKGAGDPSTSVDASGRAYITTLARNSSNQIDGYFVQYSNDKGLNWSNQIRGLNNPSGGVDKEMITTVDEMQTSPYANYFYCAWTDFSNDGIVKINRSRDRTVTFDNSTPLSSNYGMGTNVQTGPNGEVYVCWADYTNGQFPAQQMGFSFSLNGGNSFYSSLPFPYLGIATTSALPNSLFGDTRINDFPSMAVDKSCGDNRGRIYITYPEFESSNSNKSVIRVRYSDDSGASWSNSTTINIPESTQNWFPWIAVDDLTGLVNVAYHSFEHTVSNTNTYVAYSTDGGDTWQNIRVSDVAHLTSPIDNTKYAEGYAGDYLGITSFQGKSYVSWADNRSGVWQVYISKIEYGISTTISSLTNLAINTPSNVLGNQIFQAANEISVANLNPVSIDINANVEFVAGNKIILYPGFETKNGSQLIARIGNIEPCSTPGATYYKGVLDWSSGNGISKVNTEGVSAFAYPNPSSSFVTVGCLNKDAENAKIIVADMLGHVVFEANAEYVSEKQIRQVIDVSTFKKGMYIVSIGMNGKTYNLKIIKD